MIVVNYFKDGEDSQIEICGIVNDVLSLNHVGLIEDAFFGSDFKFDNEIVYEVCLQRTVEGEYNESGFKVVSATPKKYSQYLGWYIPAIHV